MNNSSSNLSLPVPSAIQEPSIDPRSFQDALRIFSLLRANVHLIDLAYACAHDDVAHPIVVRNLVNGEETLLVDLGFSIACVETALLDMAYETVLETRDFTEDELSSFFGACHLFDAINVALEEAATRHEAKDSSTY